MAPETKELTDADFAPVDVPAGNSELTDADFQSSTAQPSVSPPAEPRATTLLEDKNIVVGHPMDMSHDQVNDAIQTNFYDRPRNDFYQEAPPVHASVLESFYKGAKAFLPEQGKALAVGTEHLAMGVGGLFRWLGDAIKEAPVAVDYAKKVGESISSTGKTVVDYWRDASESEAVAPDPEIFRGSFVSNPSWTRAAAMVTRQIPALGAASALTLVTGNPLAGAEFLGLTSAGEQYAASKEEGSGFGRSSAAAALSGVGNAILMSLPMGKVLTGFGKPGVEAIARGAVEFGTLNAAMTPFNNIVAKIGGDKTRALFDGFAESIISGALSGGVLGSIFPHRGAEIDSMVQDAHKAGVPAKDIDAARAEISQQMAENPEAVMKAIEQAKPEPAPEGQYVKNKAFDIQRLGTDKATSADVREQFSGIKNEQIVRGNQLAEEIRQAVPNKADREGMFWYKAAGGDLEVLANALDDPKLEAYHGQILRALDLPQQAKDALAKVDQYYGEAGSVSQDIGTIGNIRENYQNRIYEPEPPKDFVKTETKSGIKQTTSHAKQRVFDTEFEAAQAGKKFATTDVADALAIHNEELSRVNTSRKMAEALKDSGLGAWKKDQPAGWEQVGTLEKNVPIKDKEGNAVIGEDGNQAVSRSKFYAPAGIARGLAAIADPNFVKKIDSLRNIQKFQGLVKTVDLSYSFFHHFSMAMQTVYQGGIRTLLSLPVMEQHLSTPDFKSLETDFAQHTGMTAKVESTQDILRSLTKHEGDTFDKIVDLPGVKQILKGAEKSGEFLFGKLQRYLKVSDYGEKISAWVASHPDATNEQVKAAKTGFAKQINAVYGGLNWEAMGMTKSNLSLLRLGLLAPDWTISNVQLLEQAFGDSGTAGKASRAHILTALVGGMVLTEGMSKILTGHFTDKNPDGHKLEVEVAPNVYVSFFRGGIGDIVKFSSMVSESGLQGVARFAQGKLAPIPRTAVGLLTNTQYTGRPISKKAEGPIANSYDVLKYLLTSLAPMPLGVSNALQYMKEPNVTPAGAAAVLSGVGRYSKSGGKSSSFKM